MKSTKNVKKEEVTATDVCEVCNGTGRDKPEKTCSACEGTGKKK